MKRATLGVIAIVAACNVGPAYHRPSAPTPHAGAYKEWKLATPSDAMLRGKWWQVFREPELDALEDRLAVDNQTIKQAFELYMAARAQIAEARAGYFPTVSVNPGASISSGGGVPGAIGATSTLATPTATTTTAGSTTGTITRYTAPLEATWAPDLFGRVRNTVRQAQYGAQISAADLESQRLLEQATLAATYFELRGQDALQELLDSTVEADTKVADVARTRYSTGIDTEVAVAQAEQTLEAARVQAIDAGVLRAQYEHAIATLLGVPATDFSIPKRGMLVTPPAIPIGAPSQLLERRPDIASAERKMAQANAVLGIGYAAYYPTLTLSGMVGFASDSLGTLLSWPSRVWALGATVSETVFDGGLRGATIRQDKALYNATVAGYRQTVLAAFQQVEDQLAQTRILADVVATEQGMVASAQRAYDLETVRYQTGVDPYLNLMTQQTILLSAKQALVNLRVQQMTAAVMLVEALGGGWDVADLPKP